MHAWYTGRIIVLWEGLQQLGERTTRSMGAMVQVVGDDNAKHKRLAELMEETHLCLGIPYKSYQDPLPPTSSDLPPADIQPPAVCSNAPPPPEVPRLSSPAEVVFHAAQDSDSDLPLPPSATPHTPVTSTTHAEDDDGLALLPLPLPRPSGSLSMANTPRVVGASGQWKRGLSAVVEDAEDGNRPKKQRL